VAEGLCAVVVVAMLALPVGGCMRMNFDPADDGAGPRGERVLDDGSLDALVDAPGDGWGPADAPSPDGPRPDAPVLASPSCAGLAASCGAGHNRSCCAASLVPGGTFKRSYDAVDYTNPGYPATVSDFVLDDYEVTVGRFRKFVAGYPANKPAAGAGKNPNNPADQGWDGGWTAAMPANQSALISALSSSACVGPSVWTDAPGPNENRPIGCITWYEAFAFCIWDGGRLPTEAEWNYAAAGGGGSDGQRVYPWSSPSTSTAISSANAVHASGASQDVGAKSPQGDGRWGQADLAGNLNEWVRDTHASTYPTPCANCAHLSAGDRVIRGGAWFSSASDLMVSLRVGHYTPTGRGSGTGFRCARSPTP
jgi:sulfatase modifying factor 1